MYRRQHDFVTAGIMPTITAIKCCSRALMLFRDMMKINRIKNFVAIYIYKYFTCTPNVKAFVFLTFVKTFECLPRDYPLCLSERKNNTLSRKCCRLCRGRHQVFFRRWSHLFAFRPTSLSYMTEKIILASWRVHAE